jgi:hypothetical protein
VSSRMRRRASSVFLTPRLFHDHGSKRLMNLSATPTLSTVTKSSGQAVRPAAPRSRPSQVKIDGLSVTRKDQARILEQTLQLMFSFEALTVVQFIHVLVPVVIGTSSMMEVMVSPSCAYCRDGVDRTRAACAVVPAEPSRQRAAA